MFWYRFDDLCMITGASNNSDYTIEVWTCTPYTIQQHIDYTN